MKKIVGVIIFDKLTILDAIGPIQVFESTKDNNNSDLYKVITIGKNEGIIKTGHNGEGTKITVDYTFKNCPKLDILLIPGGMGTRTLINDQEFINELKKLVETTPIIATVCTGALLLGKTGFLNKKIATTNKIAFDYVSEQVPEALWIREARWINEIKEERKIKKKILIFDFIIIFL
jgi:putative intracellular protease/amidase